MIVDREFLERHPQVPLAERDDAPKMLPMSRNNPLTMSPEWTPGGRLVHVARRYRRRSRCGTGRRRASVSGRTSTGQGQPARDGDRDSGEHAAWSRIENRLEPADSRRALNYDGRTDEGSGLPKRKSASRPNLDLSRKSFAIFYFPDRADWRRWLCEACCGAAQGQSWGHFGSAQRPFRSVRRSTRLGTGRSLIESRFPRFTSPVLPDASDM
jgi:hypothetical protein